MTQPTRQEILDAHDALAELRALVESNPPRHDTHAEKLESRIFAALPPLPQPTMAEVEWDDDKHYLAEAEHPTFGKVIMLERSACPGFIRFARAKENEPTWQAAEEKTLTPTGKRYTLTEVQDDE